MWMKAKADSMVGQAASREAGLDVQRKSIVLLQNNKVLPVAAGSKVYTMGIDTADARKAFAQVVNGEAAADGQALARDAAGNVVGRASAAGFDHAIIRVEVGNTGTNGYRSKDPATGANPAFVSPITGKVWGAADPCVTHPAANQQCVDDGYLGGPNPNGLIFGGAFPWEANNLSFTTMAASKSWRISPSLADIRAVMQRDRAGKGRAQHQLPPALRDRRSQRPSDKQAPSSPVSGSATRRCSTCFRARPGPRASCPLRLRTTCKPLSTTSQMHPAIRPRTRCTRSALV
jgi:hypothetical protein